MKSDLDNLGMRTEKKMSELLRSLIISGMNNYHMEDGYEQRKSTDREHYCFD